jgi:integrase
MRWLTYDPSADLKSPEQKAITATAAGDIWTPEQTSTFLDHVAAHRLGGCFGLTLLGLRREEVGGLRWSDVALEAGTLRIRQGPVDVNGRDTIVATKTERRFANTPASSPPSGRLQGSRQSRSASCGTRISPGCARRVSPPMWSLPGMATPNA